MLKTVFRKINTVFTRRKVGLYHIIKIRYKNRNSIFFPNFAVNKPHAATRRPLPAHLCAGELREKVIGMKLKFSIHYSTAWGESLHVIVGYKSRDGRERTYDLPMQTEDGDKWFLETAVMESRKHPVVTFSYHYCVEDGDGKILRREWNKVKREYAFDSSRDYIIPDRWRDTPLAYHLYTSAYMTANGKKHEEYAAVPLPLYRKTVIFRVSAPQIRQGESVAVCGSHPSLGDWNPSRYLKMQYCGDFEWILSVNVDSIREPIEYKYVITDDKTCRLKAWEEGENRTTEGHAMNDGQVLVMYGEALRTREKTWKAAGVAVPLFSLRTEKSFGNGDFGDLKLLADWAEKTGMKVIQLLPLNDTTGDRSLTDSNPYNIISAFALHPRYLDFSQLPPLKDKHEMTVFNRQRRELNALGHADYMAAERARQDYTDKLYRQEAETVTATSGYKKFVEENGRWLVPYAAFCALRDKFGTPRFDEWGAYARYDERKVEELSAPGSPLKDSICKTYFIQYLLHCQLAAASAYARSKGIILKGDIPVGVGRYSAETWRHTELFDMDMQMGTPPSAYEPAGQNWGFPPYKRNYAYEEWFRERLKHTEKYFDAVRIDHIVSALRVWVIPSGAIHGTLGHFSPALPLSREEIGQYGLVFRKELFTRPFVNDKVLERTFGIHARYVRDNFLTRKAYDMYELKSEYDTQVKLRAHFHGRNDENSLWIRDGLYKICSDVLFIEDEKQPDMYHPRLGAIYEPVYDILPAEEKDAFMRIYNNYFHERHNAFWENLARKRLAEDLGETRMMVCGEDLGMLPEGMAAAMDSERILTLEVQAMPKNRDYEFAHLEANPYRSVATITTHDMPTLRLWWEEDAGRVQRYYATMLQKEGKAPGSLPAHIAEEIVARHLYCPSMLCVLSIQDWLAMDGELRSRDVRGERINAPYDPYNHWKYRMDVSMEQLCAADKFNGKIRTMITRSKRL